MKIALLAEINILKRKGVFDKIRDINTALQSLKEQASLFIISGDPVPQSSENHFFCFRSSKSKVGDFIRKHALLLRLRKAIAAFNPDIIILRDTIYSPLISFAIGNKPLIIEINSDPYKEYRRSHWLEYLYFQLTQPLLYRKAFSFFCVTQELAEKPFIRRYNQPIKVAGNGIDCSRYAPRQPQPHDKPRLLFIGSPNQPWQGIEKAIVMAQCIPHFDFTLIGSSHASLPPNMHSRGYVADDLILEQIISECDAGIGTLNLSAKCLHEASPLKVRFYLACGLPVIIGYQDTDIRGEHAFVLQLGDGPDNVQKNIARIRAFVINIRNSPRVRQQARDFAEKCLDVHKKEAEKLAFMKNLLASRVAAKAALRTPAS